MNYDKTCSKHGCICNNFYMVYDGYNIQLRCINGHYNTNVSVKKSYSTFKDYDNVEDRTGLDIQATQGNIYNMSAIKTTNTVNGYNVKNKLENNQSNNKYNNTNNNSAKKLNKIDFSKVMFVGESDLNEKNA